MSADGGKRRVLVVDDDEAMRTTIAFTLMDDGYEVEEAESGEEALRALARDRSSESPIDLLVMDVRMPGLSGLDTVRRLRARDRMTRVILMTAFPSPETIDEAEALHVPLLSKPFTLDALTRLASATTTAAASR